MKHNKFVAPLADSFTSAKRGANIIYHEGLLMRDRQHHQSVHSRADYAWELFIAGRASLVQQRMRDGWCAYILQKIR